MAKDTGVVAGTRYPTDGCVSFFWRSLSSLGDSPVTTVCGCLDVGELSFTDSMLAKIGAAKPDGYPVISSVITGGQMSVSIFSTPDMTGTDKYVFGPHEDGDLTSLQRPSGAGVWNDRIRSFQLMSWAECRQHTYTTDCLDF